MLADFTCRALRFFADIVLVRHFNRPAIGQLNLAQSLALQGMGLSTCGLDMLGSRGVARNANQAVRIAMTVVAWRFVLGMVAWGGIAAIAWCVPKYHAVFQLTVLYGLSILTGAITVGWVAQALHRIPIVALAMLATNAGYFLGVELAVRADWPMSTVPLLLAGVEGTAGLALMAWLGLTHGGLSRGLPWSESWGFFQDALPIGAANYLRTLTIGSDVLLLGLFVNEEDVGLYGTGFKLYSVGMSLIAMYLGVLLPQLAAAESRGLLALRGIVRGSLWLTGPAVLLVTTVGVIAAEFMLKLLFGEPFAAAAPAIRILFLTWPLQLVAGHYRTVLVAQGRQRLDLALVGTAAVIHLIGKGCLIPIWGGAGAAGGTWLGEAVLLAFSWWAMRGDPAATRTD